MTKAIFHLRQFRVLLIVLLCSFFSLPLSAKSAYVEQSKDETTLTFYYDNDRGSHSGKTWDIDENFSFYGWRIQKVVFEDSFKDYRPTSTARWFAGFKSLVNIVGLENLNTSEVTDMSAMFEGCSSLTFLNLSNFNTSAVTKMRGMFSGCYGLKELNVSNFNTSKVTDMSDMFSRCSGLKELNVSSFNTSAVTEMGDMFSGCSGLKELNVSNFNTSAVESMWGMFSGCSGLKTILNPNIWRCEQSQNMFKGCTQLKGAVKYDASKLDATMANPETGYFSRKLPTAIGRVVFDDNNATQIYNLQGKRVNGNQRHLPAGFYIVNGKKVYLNEKP
jgi:bacterial surface protein 26-residue repeat protein (3 repeats) (fragment)